MTAARVTRGFSIDEDSSAEKPAPRRVRTRTQIMNGEGKRPPASVELALLAHNPRNPRDELTEIEETAESLRTRGQIQPITVARRAAFLAAHPELEPEIAADAEYVVIDGNRRLAAAHEAGLPELRIDVNDALVVSAEDALESALIANIHRVDVAPLDQAKAIQKLVTKHGSQGKVAQRLQKTPAWVSQRLALLELTPDLQNQVETGKLKVEPARRIGRLPKEQQKSAAAKAIQAAKAPRQRSRAGKSGNTANPQPVNAVNTPAGAPAASGAGNETVNAVNTPGSATTPADSSFVLPVGSPQAIVDALTAHLTAEDLEAVADLLLTHVTERSSGSSPVEV